MIVGKSQPIIDLKKKIDIISNYNINMLITGETGSGKELVVKQIANNKNMDIVPVNCAGISSEFFESELFGHKKGAYTSAFSDKTGLVTIAKNNILFFDEIGDISYSNQLKLLRFLESREYRKLGDTHTLKSNALFIFATNADLLKLIRTNKFRKDLYFRLCEFQLEVPSLRDHLDDLIVLNKYFIDKHNKQLKTNIKTYTTDVLKIFKTYHWPGNIRELSNVLKSAMIFCKSDIIRVSDLPSYIINHNTAITYKKYNF